jgi:hypothetical protein
VIFLATFSTITGRSAIHATTCSSAVKKNGRVVIKVDAENAKEAARKIDADEQTTERGLPFPVVCACTRSR